MTDTSHETLANAFRTYIQRTASPLLSIDPNAASKPHIKGSSPVTNAHQVVSTYSCTTDPSKISLVSMAYQCLYLSSDNRGCAETARSHFRFVVHLNASKLYTSALNELSTLYTVLKPDQGRYTFKPVQWQELLSGVPTSDIVPGPMLISFHFFVMQSILSVVSTNLTSVVKGEFSINMSVFWRAAQFFLSSSNYSAALSQSEPDQLTKYRSNAIKLLKGFLKIAQFVSQKTASVDLANTVTAFEFKILEYQALNGEDICTPPFSNLPTELLPFAKDLTSAISAKGVNSKFTAILKTEIPPHSGTLLDTLQILSRGFNEAATERLSLVLSEQQVNDEVIDQLVSFVEKLQDKASICHCIPVILQYFDKQAAHDACGPIVEKCIKMTEAMLRSETSSEACLNVLTPKLAQFLVNANDYSHLKNLVRLCFLHGKSTKDASALIKSGELDVLLFQSVSDSAQAGKARNRVEFCISALLDNDAPEGAANLMETFIRSTKFTRITQNFTRISAALLKHDISLKNLFFGNNSSLSSNMQQELLTSVLPLLQNEGISRSALVEEMEIDSPLCVSAKSESKLSLAASLDQNSIQSPADCIYATEILCNDLACGNGDKSALKRALDYGHKWVSWLGPRTTENEHQTFSNVVNTFHRMGYVDLCLSLIETYQSSTFRCLKTSYKCSLLLCQCHLNKGDLGRLPPALTNVGSELKECHEKKAANMTYNDIVEWKLLQLAFFVESTDQSKSVSKAKEIEAIFSDRSEYDLRNATGAIPLEHRLEGLYLIAEYSRLAAKINKCSANFLASMQNLKLAVKILSTILKKLESRTGLNNLKQKSIASLMHVHRSAFMVARHLGLSRDALYHLKQVTKTRDSIKSPIHRAFNSFFASINFSSANEKAQALSGYENGVSVKQSMTSPCLELVECLASFGLHDATEDEELALTVRNLSLSCLESYKASNNYFIATVPIESMQSILLEYEYSSEVSGSSFETPGSSQERSLITAVKIARNCLRDFCNLEADSVRCFDQTINVLPSLTLPMPSASVGKLFECKSILLRLEAHDQSQFVDVSKLADINQLLNRCIQLLSSFAVLKHDGADELLRQLFYYRDQAAFIPYQNQKDSVLLDATTSSQRLLPQISLAKQPEATCFSLDDFYTDLKTSLPRNWTVVTLDICSLSGDLILSRFEANSSHPTILKVPFDRGSVSRRSFKEVSQTLKCIIAESNASTKVQVTSKVKTREDRKNWWKLRFELDSRLGGVLQQLESSTIGGLKGFFDSVDSSHPEFASFSASLNDIWKAAHKNLPNPFNLTETISSLFFSLRNHIGEKCYQSDLADLIVVTSDIIRLSNTTTIYQLKSSNWIMSQITELYAKHQIPNPSKHLVLVPSFTCTEIPWESMPFLKKKSVSRMPSVSLLCKSLKANEEHMRVYEGNQKKLYYMLNPGNDLRNTQDRFQTMFQSMANASGLVGRAPSEEAMISNIVKANLFIYLGHGGGEQYLRASSMMKSFSEDENGHLPTALLMGCSSSAYQNHGKLEPTSNVFNWLVCGSPAVVSNLWDVTDKDIDILSLSLFSKWGVAGDAGEGLDLSQALAESRSSCTLKYLNGAAPILHGLPLTLR